MENQPSFTASAEAPPMSEQEKTFFFSVVGGKGPCAKCGEPNARGIKAPCGSCRHCMQCLQGLASTSNAVCACGRSSVVLSKEQLDAFGWCHGCKGRLSGAAGQFKGCVCVVIDD